jgi:cell division protein FtsB
MKGAPQKKFRPVNLRQQVNAERKRSNLVFFTLTGIALLYFGITLLAGDNGLLKYLDLQKARQKLDSDIVSLDKQNREMKKQVESLRNDPFYIEKSAREEFGLAKKNELIFQFEDARKK